MDETKRIVKFKIQKFYPKEDAAPYFEEYDVPVTKGTTVLDALHFIKEKLDSKLSYRFSCRMGICGSCAMVINGVPRLACETQVLEVDGGLIKIEPLPNFPLVRDLVTNFKLFFDKHRRIESYLIRKDTREQFNPKTEYMQPKDKLMEFLPFAYCTNCGVCYASCPILIKNENFLGPEALVQTHRYLGDSRDEGLEERLPIVDAMEGCWNCTTCSTCKINCPKELDIPESVTNLRAKILEGGKVQRTIRDALESVYLRGNPWGGARKDRTAWAEDLGAKIKNFQLGDEAELLYFIGCTPAYEARAQRMAKSLTMILQKMGTDFGILGNEENCCGSPIYNLGEKGLFDSLKEKNLEIFDKYNIERAMTSSPHCFDVFKNKYGKIDFEVQHYTQFLMELIDEGKLKFSKRVEKRVTYQDPCYLGKLNDVYDPPRKIIESIPGVEFEEMPRSKRMSLCCEGGGGLMWMEVPTPRLGDFRVKEALGVGAEVLITTCPFCLNMLDDAVKTTKVALEVIDLSQLVSIAL